MIPRCAAIAFGKAVEGAQLSCAEPRHRWSRPVELVVGADAKPELRLVEVALAPVEEIRRFVLDVTMARAPREEREQVTHDRAG